MCMCVLDIICHRSVHLVMYTIVALCDVRSVGSLLADFEDLIVTVCYLLDQNPMCKFWTAYQDRRCVAAL